MEVTEVRAYSAACATSVYNLYNNLLPQDMKVVKYFQSPRTIPQSSNHVFLFRKFG
jgi:hypothetical protein